VNVLSTDPLDLRYSGSPPVLVAATSDEAFQRARLALDASGSRVAARLPLNEAKSRIELQAAASAVWIEIDRDTGGEMDELLRHVSNEVASGRMAAVVSTCGAMLDPVAAAVADHGVELVVDADDAERIAALAVARSHRERPLLLSDVSQDRNAERLRQLSDEVSRIASILARLSSGTTARLSMTDEPVKEDLPPLAADRVRDVIRARRLRSQFFDESLFADPAWDMMLDLLQAEIAQLRVPVSSLCIAAAVPATTALRWLKSMVRQGLFIRRADPHDGRRVFVELAPTTSQTLRRYFAEVGRPAVV
jgi:DNA-binding MarR family transcriptional regulator